MDKPVPALPAAPYDLARADELSLLDFADGEWTLIASVDQHWLNWEERVRHCHVRVSALCREEDLDALNSEVGRGGEFERLGLGEQFGNLYAHQLGAVEIEPLAHRSKIWPGRVLDLHPGLPALLDLRGRQSAGNEVVFIDERLNRDVVRITHSAGPRGLSTIKVRTSELRRFLADRERAMVTYHFHQILLRRFTEEEETRHEKVDGVSIGSLSEGLKTTIQNWAKTTSGLEKEAYLQRRVHRWMVLRPRMADKSDWGERHSQVDFDVAAFTLPTRYGEMAPGRFAGLDLAPSTFAGTWPQNAHPVFMTNVYFDQAVLGRFEREANYTVADDGGIHCRHYWGLTRSTHRIGNRWLSTAIGDFAEGVPLEEWPYFKQFAVSPPSRSDVDEARRELPIAEAVNQVLRALDELVQVGRWFAEDLPQEVPPAWEAKMEGGLAVLKRWMAEFADKPTVAERITALSGLVVDGLNKNALVQICEGVAGARAPTEFRTKHGSRKWLEHFASICALARDLGTLDRSELARPARLALGWERAVAGEEDLASACLEAVKRARNALAPIAYLYDMRVGGGIAHPDSERWGEGLRAMRLDEVHLGRRTYLGALAAVQAALSSIHNDAQLALRAGWERP